jgi:hypothetical protein
MLRPRSCPGLASINVMGRWLMELVILDGCSLLDANDRLQIEEGRLSRRV